MLNFPHKKAIISQRYGGLGDNLQMSTLPEMFARHGIETYISSNNVCRNQQIYDMAWGLNPYVKGITDEPANVLIEEIEVSPHIATLNTVQRAEMLYFGAWEHAYPITYYKPKFRTDFVERAVLEFGYVTIDLNKSIDKIKENLCWMLDGQHPILLRNPVNDCLDVGTYPEYTVKDIWELADILYSCRMFAGVESGAAVLAATMKQNTPCDGIYVFCRIHFMAAKAFQYPNETPVEVDSTR